MKAAFAAWDNRIAPVFDVARQIQLVEAALGHIVGESPQVFSSDLPVQKALFLVELGVDTLVCGAISRQVMALVQGYGIQVIPFLTGELREIIKAWLKGRLEEKRFIMPGCCGRSWRQHRELGGIDKEEYSMNGKRRGGIGQGSGRGQRRGCAGGPVTIGAVSACLCPNCGHSPPHQRGVPCAQALCPKCGTAVRRS